MQPSWTITTTCDGLVEFEEDATAFAQGEPEFVNSAAPATPVPSTPASTNSSKAPLAPDQGREV